MAEPVEIPVPIPAAGSGAKAMASLVDDSIQSGALSNLAAEQAAASARRLNRADQLAGDSAAMWSVALTTPTVFAGMGFRIGQQSAGWPAASGTGTSAERSA